MIKLDAKKLRLSEPTEEDLKKIVRNPFCFVLDEVLDTYNIGSMFRLADAVAAEKIYLCGKMEYPPSIKIHRAAVGTQNWVPWEKCDSALKKVKELKKKDYQIVAIEQNPKSINYCLLPKYLKSPVALVLGHETKGVNKKVLKEADLIVEIPMLGINKSFNVWGSAAVVSYKLLEMKEKMVR